MRRKLYVNDAGTLVRFPREIAQMLHEADITHVDIQLTDEGILLVPTKQPLGDIAERPEWAKPA